MIIPDFNYHRPRTLHDACHLLETCQDGVVMAGGTDLLVDLKQAKRRYQNVISLTRIPELQCIHVEKGALLIGAAITHNQLVESRLIRETCSALSEAAETIGTEQIRNTATVGGNLCTAASCADTAPILIAYGAKVELLSSRSNRTLVLEDFFVSHRTTALKPGEILARILVPVPKSTTGAAFKKFGLREAANISVASVAALVRLDGDRCDAARLVMGAVAPTPKIATGAAQLVKGKSFSELMRKPELLEKVGQAVAEQAEPIDDIRGSARFRREITAILARRALVQALLRAQTPSR